MENQYTYAGMGANLQKQYDVFRQTNGYRTLTISQLTAEANTGNPFALYVLAIRYLKSNDSSERSTGMDILNNALNIFNSYAQAGNNTSLASQMMAAIFVEQGHQFEAGNHGTQDGLTDELSRQKAAFICYDNAHELNSVYIKDLVRCLLGGIGTDTDTNRGMNLLAGKADTIDAESMLQIAIAALNNNQNIPAVECLQMTLIASDIAAKQGVAAVARYLLASLGETDENGNALEVHQETEFLNQYVNGPYARLCQQALNLFPLQSSNKSKSEEKTIQTAKQQIAERAHKVQEKGKVASQKIGEAHSKFTSIMESISNSYIVTFFYNHEIICLILTTFISLALSFPEDKLYNGDDYSFSAFWNFLSTNDLWHTILIFITGAINRFVILPAMVVLFITTAWKICDNKITVLIISLSCIISAIIGLIPLPNSINVTYIELACVFLWRGCKHFTNKGYRGLVTVFQFSLYWCAPIVIFEFSPPLFNAIKDVFF